ncbi:MAG: hypothetical protein EHM70_15155 [Chloroflexota bacterium]|nr:MAG: hypothetical protein EHM70_15155 [Chloroflexota bacterium]
MAKVDQKKTTKEFALPHTYRAYIVRCSLVDASTSGKDPSWRFYVEEINPPHRKKLIGSLDNLMTYLESELGYSASTDPV